MVGFDSGRSIYRLLLRGGIFNYRIGTICRFRSILSGVLLLVLFASFAIYGYTGRSDEMAFVVANPVYFRGHMDKKKTGYKKRFSPVDGSCIFHSVYLFLPHKHRILHFHTPAVGLHPLRCQGSAAEDHADYAASAVIGRHLGLWCNLRYQELRGGEGIPIARQRSHSGPVQ